MPPRAAPGRAPGAGVRTPGVIHRRDLVVARVVPVRAPLVDVLAQAEEAQRVEGGVGVDRLGAFLPTPAVVGECLGWIVPPGIEDLPIQLRRPLPLGLG